MQESIGGAIDKATVKQLSLPSSRDAKLLLSSLNFLFGLFIFYTEISTKVKRCSVA